MGKIHWGRVVGGGLVAGLVMNASEATLHGAVLGQDATDLYRRLNLQVVPTPPNPIHLALLTLMTFVLGVAAVWLYAAIRPRFGAGPRTAIVAGLAVWVLAHLWSGVYLAEGFAGLMTPRLAWLPVAWGLGEALLGTLAGAWLYRE